MSNKLDGSIHVCRACGVELVIGVNWTHGCFLNSDRECRVCRNKRTARYRTEKYPQFRAKAKQASVAYYHRHKGRLASHYHAKRRTAGHRFSVAKSSAKRRGVAWTLTKCEYASLINKPCEYCGFPLCETGAGLDQVVPGSGYTLNNVVPCCGECNVAKSDAFTFSEMKVIGVAIRSVKIARASGG